MSASLVLHVRDPAYIPTSVADIEQVLLQLGLIGKAWGDGAQHRYLIGERFLQLVTFLGCAPAIELEPPANGDSEFCHVGISDLYPAPQFMADAQDVLPRCPHCRKRYADWQFAIQSWRTDPAYQAQCPACQQSLSPMELDWCSLQDLGTCLSPSLTSIHVKRFLPRPCYLPLAKPLTRPGIIFIPASLTSSFMRKEILLTVLSPAYTLTAMLQNLYFSMFAIVLRLIKAWHVNVWLEKPVI